MPRVKKESNASSAVDDEKQYPPGTMLAVDLYTNGNYFEAILKHYRTEKRDKNARWAYVQYIDDRGTKGWIDLNIIKVVELARENILTQDDCDSNKLRDEDKGFMGRRLTVLWLDEARYTGTITKTTKDKKNFVFIHYDNGDKCWYNLAPESEEPSRIEETETNNTGSKRRSAASASATRGSGKSTTTSSRSSSSKVKREPSIKTEDESVSASRKAMIEENSKKHEMARKELEKKYPIGSTIAVDIYHDEHYHEAILKKYLLHASKKQQAKGEQWVYIHFLDKSKTKQWIDLSCIKAIKMTREKILRLDQVKKGTEKGFLGKRIVLEWSDGNKYRGLATRSARDNKHFVYLEYDDGDECWCDLQREREWSIDDEEDDENDDEEDEVDDEVNDEVNDEVDDEVDEDLRDSSDESLEQKSRAKPKKRRGSTQSSGRSAKKDRPSEESYDF